MTINLNIPQRQSFKPTITVIGVGGAGGNAVNNMISSSLEGVDFVVANTDAQSLEQSLCQNKVQLGNSITQGLGAGSYPEVGRAAAEEAEEEILDYLSGRNMVFVTAGMGGGTGTGAAPVIARIAREQGILTVAVVTKPFHFEGGHRMRIAELGIEELQKYVDTMIVIPNQNLFRIADKNTTFLDAFKMADEVLHSGVRGITDLMVMPGLINLDFSDVRAVMSEMGKAMMGTGVAEGDNRALAAAEAAIANPLLDNVSMKGARGVLINITGGSDLTLFEVDEAANRIREEVDPEANIIFGSAFDKDLVGKVRVSVVATGIETIAEDKKPAQHSAPENKIVHMPRREKQEAASNVTRESQRETVAQNREPAREEQKIAAAAAPSQPAAATPPPAAEAPRKQQEAAETHARERNEVFYGSEPVEPKNYKGEPKVTAEKLDWGNGASDANSSHGYHSGNGDASLDPSRNRASGLFGGLFGSKKTDEPAKKPTDAVLSEMEQGHAAATQTAAPERHRERDVLSLVDNDLDIPAFLRRK